jgi:hypothetical protein
MSAAAFSVGDYSTAARNGSPDDWRTWAAWGLLGRADRALDGLRRFDDPQARFYEATALWIDGDDEQAARLLRGQEEPHARNLLTLIERPVINVLAMMPGNRHGPHVHLLGAQADSRFRLNNISIHPDDLRIRPYAAVDDYVAAVGNPDMFIVEMVEWHQIPPDFRGLPCKTIGVTSDFDLHMQGLHPWLRAFDELVVNDHTEFAGLAPTVDRPISVFPLVFGCPQDMPVPVRRERDIDVFMSGTLFGAYHPDKAALLHRLLAEDGLNVLFVNGHLSEPAYFDLLSRAKTTISYYRRPGGMVTRGIEAACMGCVSLVQETSVLGLYADPPNGLTYYDSTPEGLAAAVKATLADYDAREAAAWAAWPTLRRRLSAASVASRFLRFCVFLAAHPRRAPLPARPLVQKRNMFWKGWTPGNGDPDFIAALREGNVARLSADLERATNAAVDNDIAREAMLDCCARLMNAPQAEGAGELAATAFDIWRAAAARHSDSLVIRFNFIRAAMHFGDAAVAAEAMAAARLTTAAPAETWRVHADDDVFPYDYCGGRFDYRTYIDTLVAGMSPDGRSLTGEAERRMRDLMLASLHHYLATVDDDDAHAATAAKLNPEFDLFRFDAARRALRSSDSAERRRAAEELARLTKTSVVAAQAHHALRVAARAGLTPPPSVDLDRHVERLETLCFESEAYIQKINGGYFDAQVLGPGGVRGVRVVRDKAERQRPAPVVSVIVVDGGLTGGDAAAVAATARRFDPAGAWCETILVDLGDRPDPTVADTVLVCGQDAPLFHRHRGFNAGLMQARGRVLVLADRIDALPSDLPAVIREAFDHVDGEEPPALAATATTADGRTVVLACRAFDAFMCGGLDQHEAFHGAYHDLGELAARLVHAGCAPLTLTGPAAEQVRPATAPPPWARIWPAVAGGEPRRRPHREMPGLFVHGLRRSVDAPESRRRLAAGLDLTHLLQRKGNSRRTADGLTVAADTPPGRILGEVPLPLPPGRYRIEADVRAAAEGRTCEETTAFARLDVLCDGKKIAEAAFSPTCGLSMTMIIFDVQAEGDEIDVDLRQLGCCGWTLAGLTLRPDVDNAP